MIDLTSFFTDELWSQINVQAFSANVLGYPYERIQGVLYPRPPYKTFTIAKRSGGLRVIRAPRKRLKILQQAVLRHLEERAGKPKPCSHAFTKGRSIVTNARRHLERKPHFVLNLDLESFFPSINFYRVRGVLRKAPFNFSHEVATMLAQMCTSGNELPQGAPTSPFLANQVCRSMDRDLMALAKRHQATYTRYSDDITFSFSTPNPASLPENICTFSGGVVALGGELLNIIAQHNFRINPAKTRMSTRRRRMEVTGVTINEFPNVKRDFIDRIRGALHAWERYGYQKAQNGWEARVTEEKQISHDKRAWQRQTRSRVAPELRRILWGKLLFVHMVRGSDNSIYTRLAEKYNRLVEMEVQQDTDFPRTLLPIKPIVRNAADVEDASFVVEWYGDYPLKSGETTVVGAQGSAFAYKRHDRLITCDHVLVYRDIVENESITADIQSTPGVELKAKNPVTGQEWRLRVLHRDAVRDLAILEFIDPPPRRRFFSGMDAPITKHAPGHLIGFPNWSAGRPVNIDPVIVTNRLPRTALQRIEINQLIRTGNSGGPFVDALFRLAGVAQQGAQQDGGNNECLCVTEVDRWIATCVASEAGAPTVPDQGGGV